MIVAFFEIDGGAALMARAIFAASGLPPVFVIVSCPDLALGSSGFVFSCAVTVRVATIRKPVAIASALRMVPSLEMLAPAGRCLRVTLSRRRIGRKEGSGQVTWCTLVPR